MKTLLRYPLSVLFYLCFGIVLVFFHCVQWIALYGFGYQVHKVSVDVLNYFILRCLNILGTRFSYTLEGPLPKTKGVIFVANHQSTFDIPPLIWYLRKYHAKFVSKKELGRGIPSVSFNLRHGGSVLIDRKNPKKALKKIEAFGKQVAKNHHSVIIFPEGTRSRDGKMQPFRRAGLVTLLKSMPEATLVPISIENSWHFAVHNYFPMPVGNQLRFTFHAGIQNNPEQIDQLIDRIESTIKDKLEN
ncbi:MAG: lysophospholipid acyltransferase family protein [Flavobacteriaceae bacterium]